MLIVTGSFLVITVVERHDKRLLWIATGSWGAVNRKYVEAGLQMESRGESHTGFLLHRVKQNSSKQ